MFSCPYTWCVGFCPPAFLIMVPRWLPHLQASFPHTAMLRYHKGAVFPHNGRKTFPRSCRGKVSFKSCLLELPYTSIPKESMARKMEFPQWTLLTETYSLELEKDSFTEHTAMIRVNQARVLLVSNIGGLAYTQMQP